MGAAPIVNKIIKILEKDYCEKETSLTTIREQLKELKERIYNKTLADVRHDHDLFKSWTDRESSERPREELVDLIQEYSEMLREFAYLQDRFQENEDMNEAKRLIFTQIFTFPDSNELSLDPLVHKIEELNKKIEVHRKEIEQKSEESSKTIREQEAIITKLTHESDELDIQLLKTDELKKEIEKLQSKHTHLRCQIDELDNKLYPQNSLQEESQITNDELLTELEQREKLNARLRRELNSN